ncbi:MAG: hypothetical protein Phog2KO_43560 [Phototrophicaceae bacterium]
MELGNFSLSLNVKDIKASRAFYEKLGFEVFDGNEEHNWLMLRCGETKLGLFQGMFEQNLLTFNPQDVRAIQKKLKAEGVELITEAEEGEGPASITLIDPDGNPILFDQHDPTHAPMKEPAGKAAWVDLTVDDASSIRDFYQAVIGWDSAPVSQGEYDDYNMMRAGTPTTGICHKIGGNKDIPSQWMVYFTVDNYEATLEKVTELGGKILVPTRGEVGGRFAVIEDPAGAVCTLYEN